MKKLMITGASGLLGSNLLPLLSNCGLQIFAVTTNKKKLAQIKEIVPIELDLFSEEDRRQAMREIAPEYLLHLAWDQKKEIYRNDSSNLLWLSMSLNLFIEFVENGGRRFVFAGTSGEYEGRNGRFSEYGRKTPPSLYGASKHAFVQAAGTHSARAGVEFAVARYFTIYGENDPHYFGAIPAAVRTFLNGSPFVCKSPNTIRDYIYVKDAAEATKRLLLSSFTGEMNIASGLPHSMREVFSLIAEKLGKEHLLSFENETVPGNLLVADTRRMEETLSYRPETDFTEGMEKTIAFWKGQWEKGELS